MAQRKERVVAALSKTEKAALAELAKLGERGLWPTAQGQLQEVHHA